MNHKKNPTMKTTRIQNLIAVVLLSVLVAADAVAQTPAVSADHPSPITSNPPRHDLDSRRRACDGLDATEFRDARPWHRVYVDGFWKDRSEVTNEQFKTVVKATGHVTVVEHATATLLSLA